MKTKLKLLSANEISSIGASVKAPEDISKILREQFQLEEKRIIYKSSKNKIINFCLNRIYALRRILNLFLMNKNIYYIMQSNYFHYPFFLPNLSSKILNNKKFILYIHDINGLRDSDDYYLKKELKLFNKAVFIIAHNNKMKQFLVENGVSKEKIYILECFDYLCKNEKKKELNNISKIRTICYAGNLSKEKSKFLYQIDDKKINFKLNIYGKGVNGDINEKINYKGVYNADEVRKMLDGDIGLVWDGCFDSQDENEYYKNYTKYNNPHKLSCYLAADLPVIVWEKAAMAEFVKKNNIGYTINNIYDINKIDFSDYDVKKKNAKLIGEKIRKGYYTTKVLNEIINKNNIEMIK